VPLPPNSRLTWATTGDAFPVLEDEGLPRSDEWTLALHHPLRSCSTRRRCCEARGVVVERQPLISAAQAGPAEHPAEPSRQAVAERRLSHVNLA